MLRIQLHSLSIPWERISTDRHDLHNSDTIMDAVYILEDPNKVLYISQKILPEPDQYFVNLAVMEINHPPRSGFLALSFSHHLQSLSDEETENIGGNNLQPERGLLLQLFLSPHRLNGESLLDIYPVGLVTKENLSCVVEEIFSGFKSFLVHFNTLKQKEKVTTSKNEDYKQKVGEFLQNRGNYTFWVLEIGKFEIGGKKYWAYTGSEGIIKDS